MQLPQPVICVHLELSVCFRSSQLSYQLGIKTQRDESWEYMDILLNFKIALVNWKADILLNKYLFIPIN